MKRKLLKYFKSLNLQGNELKDVIQQYAVDKWIDTGCKSYFSFFTGFGKTNTALTCIKRFFAAYDGSITTLVPTTKLYKQWNKKIDVWNLRQENKNIDIYVLNTYTMNFASLTINRNPEIFIADELHRMCNDQSKFFSKALEITNFEMFLGLSATLDAKHKQFLAKFDIYECFEITLEEGLELGLVPEFDIYNLGCELTVEEEEKYDYWNGLYTRKLKYFGALTTGKATDLAMACTKDKGTSIISIDERRVKKSNVEWIDYVSKFYNITHNDVKEAANIWRNAMTARNICLQSIESKFDITIDILNNLYKGKQAIAFVASIKEADYIQSKTNAKAVHSKLSDNLRESILEEFEEGKLGQIITVKSLDEGFDSEQLEVAIAKHFTSVNRTQLQRLGRCLRFDSNNPTKHPVYISLYSISSRNKDKIFQDKIQLINAQKGMIGIKWIKILNEIRL